PAQYRLFSPRQPLRRRAGQSNSGRRKPQPIRPQWPEPHSHSRNEHGAHAVRLSGDHTLAAGPGLVARRQSPGRGPRRWSIGDLAPAGNKLQALTLPPWIADVLSRSERRRAPAADAPGSPYCHSPITLSLQPHALYAVVIGVEHVQAAFVVEGAAPGV